MGEREKAKGEETEREEERKVDGVFNVSSVSSFRDYIIIKKNKNMETAFSSLLTFLNFKENP